MTKIEKILIIERFLCLSSLELAAVQQHLVILRRYQMTGACHTRGCPAKLYLHMLSSFKYGRYRIIRPDRSKARFLSAIIILPATDNYHENYPKGLPGYGKLQDVRHTAQHLTDIRHDAPSDLKYA